MDLQNLPVVNHPFTQYTLADAVNLAVANAKAFDHNVPGTLTEVREYIKGMYARCGHNWLTGAAALDVLDAAIAGTGIDVKTCRYR